MASASAGVIGILVLLAVLVVPVAGGILLIVLGRKRGKGYPACGQCGYDVSGTLGTVNARCPECGSDFGIVGIAPATTRSNKLAIAGGVLLICIPLVCVGGMMLTSYTAMSRARTAAVNARAQAVAAQQAAAATQIRQVELDFFRLQNLETKRIDAWRQRSANVSPEDARQRLIAIWSEFQSDPSLAVEDLQELRAEFQSLSDRAVADAPQYVREYIARPVTAQSLAAMTAEQVRETLAANAKVRQFFEANSPLGVRLKAEFDMLMEATRRNPAADPSTPAPVS